MGYYSHYEITAEDRRPSADEVLDELFATNEDAAYARDEGNSKWYEWANDLCAFSAKHPGILFTVRREGEESGDIEIGYFLNGKQQGGKAELRLPEFVPPGNEESP